ncbi:MAG: type II toxin-antitoxin system PemK/MazF family toxin [Polyangiales bacterium]
MTGGVYVLPKAMTKSSATWNPCDVYWLEERRHGLGHEIAKARPWTILSPKAINARQYFIACPDTGGARAGSLNEFLVEAPEAKARLDAQQLWTLPSDRAQEKPRVAVLTQETRGALREKLDAYLSPPRTVRDGFVGNVFWVNFVHRSGSIAKESDLLALKRNIKTSAKVDWEVPRATHLSCVCISAARGVADSHGQSLPLATFVPLMALKGIEKMADHPHVTVPPEARAHVGQLRFALTQCLFTLDYTAMTEDLQGDENARLFRSGEKGMVSWPLTVEEHGLIVADVRKWISLFDEGE